MQSICWGIWGTGLIARSFKKCLSTVADAKLVAVGSRELSRAKEMIGEDETIIAVESIEALAQRPDIDVIYVASVNTDHLGAVLACLNAGKAVLCEKPIAVNASEFRQMADVAYRRGLFLMEAMWTRFFPVTQQVVQWVQSGSIGKVQAISGAFSSRVQQDTEHRLLNTELGGGALLDVGCYLIHYAQMIFQTMPVSVTGMAEIGPSGVDVQDSFLLRYPGGAMATLSCGFQADMDDCMRIYGDQGRIDVPQFWSPESAMLRTAQQMMEIRHINTGGGMEYEIKHVHECLRSGDPQSPELPWSTSLDVMSLCDGLRMQWKLRYPCED